MFNLKSEVGNVCSGQMATVKYRAFEGEKEFRLFSDLLVTVIDGNSGMVTRAQTN